MKFYQNIRQISSLLTLTAVFALCSFSVSAMAKGSKSAMITTTTTTTTTESTTESTTEAATESTTQPTTEAMTNADGTPMSDAQLKVYNIVKNTPQLYKTGAQPMPDPVDTFTDTNDYMLSRRSFTFSGGDSYNILRYEYKENATQPINGTIDILGSSIEIRYVDEDSNWVCTTNPDNVVKDTLFIDTDKGSLIVSVPGVYKDSYQNNTLEFLPELETPVTITKTDTGYTVSYSFTPTKDTIGEIWYLSSSGKLADWNNTNHFKVLNQDLNTTHRISFDGYYYPTPYNYEPTGTNVLYRQPSDYVGSLFVNYGDFPAAYDLGYVLTYTCMKNQNVQGYWATGPKSEWLATDFGIGTGFYDTRFNTDFATSLLAAYQRYGDDDFLTAAVTYAEYFASHALNHSYATKSGGYLVEDYGSFDGNHTKTHVSLNHQLAEMNYLYKLYDITQEESYLQLADKMLLGIDDTRDQWVLANNNLNYALYYTGTYNTMVDYPYLTYNDLYNTKKILNNYFNRSDNTIDYLMSCKLAWMQANNVTGYYTDN